MLFGTLALMLAAAPAEEGRGAIPAEAERSSTRLRLGVAGAALLGTASFSHAGGVGLSVDLGAVVNDRFSLFLHGEVGSVVFTGITSGGAMVEYALSAHFSAALGVAFSRWVQLLYDPIIGFLGFSGLMFPVRVSYSPARRASSETANKGLLIGLQLAPGLGVLTSSGELSTLLPAFSAALTIGYAWR